MPKKNPPNEIQILWELLNTYLEIRVGEGNHGWENVDLSNPPTEGTQYEKLEIIRNLFSEIPTNDVDHNPRPWIELIYLLANLEEKERAIKKDTGTWGRAYFIKDESLLERTMHAMRSFIVQKLVTSNTCDDYFKDRKKELLSQVQELESDIKIAKANRHGNQKIIDELEGKLHTCTLRHKALSEAETDLYHHTFFSEVIEKRDQHKDAKGNPYLHENSFEDYCQNVMTNVRLPAQLNQLLNRKPVKESALQKHSTFSPAPAESSTENVKRKTARK